MKRKIFIFIVILMSNNIIYGQTWLKMYPNSISLYPRSICEDYDKGYLNIGQCNLVTYHAYGWIMKTDINGNQLWSRYFGDSDSRALFKTGKLLPNGEKILIGGTEEYQNKMCPIAVKINPCGEKIWCRIYKSSTGNSGGQDVVPLDDGGFMMLITGYKSTMDVWLLRLDNEGYILWEQEYVADPSEFATQIAHNVIQTSDSNFLITGDAYSPDSLWPGYFVQKIFMVKVTSDGEVIFEKPFSSDNGLISDSPYNSIEDSGNTYLTTGRIVRPDPPQGDSPALFKVSSTGELLFYRPLIINCSLGAAGPFIQFTDSTLGISAAWDFPGGNIDTMGVLKTDREGNILAKKTIYTNFTEAVIWGASRTYNNCFIGAGVTEGTAFTVKLRSDLEYDSIYTRPFTYDSLCPYAITTDTIPLNDCQVITSVFDPSTDKSKTRLHVFPNPASSNITIQMPEYLIRNSSAFGVTSYTCYHQWTSVQLEIYDLFGKRIYQASVPQQEKLISLDVSSWKAGMYVARLVYRNSCVGSEKFVVRK